MTNQQIQQNQQNQTEEQQMINEPIQQNQVEGQFTQLEGEMVEELPTLGDLLRERDIITNLNSHDLSQLRHLFDNQEGQAIQKAALLYITVTRQASMDPNRGTGYLSMGDVDPELPDTKPAMVYSQDKASNLGGFIPDESQFRLLGSLEAVSGSIYIKKQKEVVELPLAENFQPFTVAVDISYQDAVAIERFRRENSFPQALTFPVVVNPAIGLLNNLQLPRTSQRLGAQAKFVDEIKKKATGQDKYNEQLNEEIQSASVSQMSLLFNLGTPALKAISGAVSTSTAEVEDLSGEDIVKMLQGQSQAISNFARTAGQNSRVQAIKQRIDQTQGTNEQTQAQEQTYLEENT